MNHRNAVIGFLILAAGILLGTYFFPSIRGFVSGVAPLAAPILPLPESGSPLPFTLPQGFAAYLFAKDLPGARVLARDPRGTLVVSLSGEGRIVALPDTNNDGVADTAITILEKLDEPHGMVFRCDPLRPTDSLGDDCVLFVAEKTAVRSYAYDAQTYSARLIEKLTDLPGGGGHSTRSLLLHPDGRHLLVAIGSSCNVCRESDPRRAAMLSIDLETKKVTTFATGLRNTVFLALSPLDGQIWGADMGRDLLGDELPPDEINLIKEGGTYGWPNCYGKNVHDADFDKNTYIRNPCMEPLEKASLIDIPAHSAPLGLAFIPEEGWPEAYRLDLLIAYHGSWNRSIPTGYKVVRVELDSKRVPTGKIKDFMTGFFTDQGKVMGRPVALLAEPGGVLFVSDDRAGAIYRIQKTTE